MSLITPSVLYLSLEVLHYQQITEAAISEDASLLGVQKEREGQQVCALAMGADRDAKSWVAIKVQKAERHIAKPMEEGKGVSN